MKSPALTQTDEFDRRLQKSNDMARRILTGGITRKYSETAYKQFYLPSMLYEQNRGLHEYYKERIPKTE